MSNTNTTSALRIPNAVDGDLPPKARAIIESISGAVIGHSGLTAAAEFVQSVVTANQALSEPRHAILIGESGCGKTTLLDTIRDSLPPEEEVFKLGIGSTHKVLVLSLPSTITPRSMAVEMLRALGDQSNLNGTCQELTARLIYCIRRCNVQIIFLDEFQHLLALGRGWTEGANKRLLEARNWIKSIIVATHVTFVLMGMPDTLALIESEPQLQRRFTHLWMMEPFGRPHTGDTEMVYFADGLLKVAVGDKEIFKSADWFSRNVDHAERLYIATGGVPSTIKDLVIHAAMLAYRQESTKITMDHFAHAFAELRQPRLELEAARMRREHRQTLLTAMEGHVINPFAAPTDELRPLLLKMVA